MKYENGKVAGLLILVGGILCVLGIIIAEALYPGYSTSENYISDLGVGPSAVIFNSSVFLLGVCGLAASYFIQRAYAFKALTIVLAITGIGAMGVGLFTEDAEVLHAVFSFITFTFGGIATLMSYRLQRPPLSYMSVMLGIMSLSALILFGSGTYLGLGKGGMERMIAYPALLWVAAFGGHLIGDSRDISTI